MMETSTKFDSRSASSASSAEEISRSEVLEFRAWQKARQEADAEHAAWLEAKAKSDAERAFAERVAEAVRAAMPEQPKPGPSATEVAAAVAAEQRAEARRILGTALTNGLRAGLIAAGVAAYGTLFAEGMRKLERVHTTGTTYPRKGMVGAKSHLLCLSFSYPVSSSSDRSPR